MTNLLIFPEDITKTSKHLDWLSITISADQVWRNFLPFYDLHKTGHGRHGYREAFVDKRTGARIETGSLDSRMGTHITLSGDVLNAMRDELGMVDNALCKRIVEWDGKCSRIDLAIDVFGATFTPAHLSEALENHSARISTRTWRFIDGHKNGVNGATVDTGSTVSDKRFRFYDKAAEQGIKDGDAWVRLELQLRRLYAKATLSDCAEQDVSSVTALSIGKYLVWQNSEYQAALAGHGGILSTTPRKPSTRQRWLLGQVAKALAAELVIHPDFIMKFMNAVRYFGGPDEQKFDKP